MERELAAVRVAVLLVTDAHTAKDATTVNMIVERLATAGHELVESAIVKDSVQLVRAQFLRWLADADVDVVIALAGVDTDSTNAALQPSITKPIEGFTDLFR